MFDLLDTVVGPYSVKEYLIGLVLFGVALQIYTSIKHKVAADRATSAIQKMKCLGCGWHGKVSKFQRTCPRCGNAISRAR